MLQVKSFKMDDDTAMNDLLTRYRIAQGAGIFVSNGEIVIPYEDGEPMNKAQQIISIKEQKNTMHTELAIIEHSQEVVHFLIKDAKERVITAQADHDEALSQLTTAKGKKLADADEKYLQSAAQNNPELKAALARRDETLKALNGVKSSVTQLENQVLMNEHEILRININCQVFDESIEELTNSN
jgi:hypothetical protein